MTQNLPLLVLSVGVFLWLCSDAYQRVSRVRAAKRLLDGKVAFLNEHGKTIIEAVHFLGAELLSVLGRCEECEQDPIMLKCGTCGAVFNLPLEPGALVKCPHCTGFTNHETH